MNILVGYDGTKASEEALKVAMEHARVFDGRLTVLRSVKAGTVTENVEVQYAEEDLAKAKSQLEAAGLACETHLLVRNFSPGEDIVEFAQNNDIQEIVIGVRRRSKVGKLFFGSNAQYVILKSPCPVITVH